MSIKNIAVDVGSLVADGWSREGAEFLAGRLMERPEFARDVCRRLTGCRPPRAVKTCIKVTIPASLRWEVFERDDFRCKGCGTRRFLSADHIVPENLGGPTTLANLQTLCQTCNSKKGARIA